MKKKPDYIPDNAWKMYQTYNLVPLIPSLNADQKRNLKKTITDFFEKLFFSECLYTNNFWKNFPKNKDAGEFVRVIFISLMDGKREREAILLSKERQNDIIKTIKELKGKLKNAGRIFELPDFLNNNGTIKTLDSLEKFVTEAQIGIKGSAFASRWKAISATNRQSKDDKIFTRCLYAEMTSTLGFKPDIKTKALISALLPCLFTEDRNGKNWQKFVTDTVKVRNSTGKKPFQSRPR